MNPKDVRWLQRFANFNKAYAKLDEAVGKLRAEYPAHVKGQIDADAFLDDIIKEGVIQRFEYTHELAWNVMKDFLSEVGNVKVFGSRDATKEAFAADMLPDGEVWMDMIQSRNKTSHTYNEATANDIFFKIMNTYHPAFATFKATMENMRSGTPGNLHALE